MSRIEFKPTNNYEELEREVTKLKKGLKGKQKRKLINGGSCLLILFILVLLFCFCIGYVVAKSGLKEVPVLTKLFYHEPNPTYLVPVDNYANLEEKILDELTDKVTKQAILSRNDESFSVFLELTDSQLTDLIRQQVIKNNSLNNQVDYIQVAVESEKIELFLKKKEPSKIILTLDMVPQVIDGKFKVKIEKFKLGDLSLPVFIADMFVGKVVETSVNGLLKVWQSKGQMKTINLYDQAINFELLINNDLF